MKAHLIKHKLIYISGITCLFIGFLLGVLSQGGDLMYHCWHCGNNLYLNNPRPK
jgi:hypothetical protein